MIVKALVHAWVFSLILGPTALSTSEPKVEPVPRESSVRMKAVERSDPFRPRSRPPAREGSAKKVASGSEPATGQSQRRRPTYCELQNFEGVRCARLAPLVLPPDEAAPEEEAEAPPARRELTAGEVRRAVREIEMPALDITVQPGTRTLVNVPTIFSTQARAVNRSIDLLGYAVEVEARATGFTWHHGDGTRQSTTRPGRPYPAKDVTHTYRRTAATVRPRVDTTYTVRYRVDDGDWTDLGQPLTAEGAPTTLTVRQAAPVLTRR